MIIYGLTHNQISFIHRAYPLCDTSYICEVLAIDDKRLSRIATTIGVKKIGSQTILEFDGLKAKLCSKCKVLKELDKFKFASKPSTGLDCWCIKCTQDRYN